MYAGITVLNIDFRSHKFLIQSFELEPMMLDSKFMSPATLFETVYFERKKQIKKHNFVP